VLLEKTLTFQNMYETATLRAIGVTPRRAIKVRTRILHYIAEHRKSPLISAICDLKTNKALAVSS